MGCTRNSGVRLCRSRRHETVRLPEIQGDDRENWADHINARNDNVHRDCRIGGSRRRRSPDGGQYRSLAERVGSGGTGSYHAVRDGLPHTPPRTTNHDRCAFRAGCICDGRASRSFGMTTSRITQYGLESKSCPQMDPTLSPKSGARVRHPARARQGLIGQRIDHHLAAD
jgi:hypothetical protein